MLARAQLPRHPVRRAVLVASTLALVTWAVVAQLWSDPETDRSQPDVSSQGTRADEVSAGDEAIFVDGHEVQLSPMGYPQNKARYRWITVPFDRRP